MEILCAPTVQSVLSNPNGSLTVTVTGSGFNPSGTTTTIYRGADKIWNKVNVTSAKLTVVMSCANALKLRNNHLLAGLVLIFSVVLLQFTILLDKIMSKTVLSYNLAEDAEEMLLLILHQDTSGISINNCRKWYSPSSISDTETTFTVKLQMKI